MAEHEQEHEAVKGQGVSAESWTEARGAEGWREPVRRPSLPEVFRTIPVPQGATFWRRFLAFFGPGYLVAVGYMDPGNWATDIMGGRATTTACSR